MRDLSTSYVLVEVIEMNTTSIIVSTTLTHECVASVMHTSTGYLNLHTALILYKAYL